MSTTSPAVEDAHACFDAVPIIARKLQTLLDVGLGYIRLGQAATTLSSGEAQREKLALELSKSDAGLKLNILDEPATGPHFHDVRLLQQVPHQLREAGITIVVIEHNLDGFKIADWLIDMGPEGCGGCVVVAGSPEEVADCADSHTGRFLKALPWARALTPSRRGRESARLRQSDDRHPALPRTGHDLQRLGRRP